MLQELNIGGSIVVAALEEACGAKRSKIKELYDSLGDLGRKDCLVVVLFVLCMVSPQISFHCVTDHCMLCEGDVAQLCRQTQPLLAPPPPLSIQGVFSVLRKIRYGLK